MNGSSPHSQSPREPWRHAALWSNYLWAVRRFFHERGFLEATTPSLVKNPGMEPELEPFSTQWRSGSRQETLFLPTSPELHLKQLMAQGLREVFEIKTVFRNEELTPLHEPEFQMLEWYRTDTDLATIRQDVRDLLDFLTTEVFAATAPSTTITELTVRDLFRRHLQLDLRVDTSRDELLAMAEKLELHPSEDWGWNDIFHLIWAAKIEPLLPETPFFLSDYPATQAALARLTREGWADRTEFFWRRVEIANGFNELTDAAEQRRRFERDQKQRVIYARTPLEIDENFMRALEAGLPPCAGIALGLDRLFMVMAGLPDLKSSRAFGIEHQLSRGL